MLLHPREADEDSLQTPGAGTHHVLCGGTLGIAKHTLVARGSSSGKTVRVGAGLMPLTYLQYLVCVNIGTCRYEMGHKLNITVRGAPMFAKSFTVKTMVVLVCLPGRRDQLHISTLLMPCCA